MGKKSAALAQVEALISKGRKKGNNDKGGGSRKYGRTAHHPSSQRYKAERRWEKNKLRRIARHLKKYPNDEQAKRALQVAKAA